MEDQGPVDLQSAVADDLAEVQQEVMQGKRKRKKREEETDVAGSTALPIRGLCRNQGSTSVGAWRPSEHHKDSATLGTMKKPHLSKSGPPVRGIHQV